MKSLAHILIVGILTVLTQIGGLVWIINFGFFKYFNNQRSRLIRIGTFVLLYLLATFMIVPTVAKFGGRNPLPLTKSNSLVPHTYLTPLLNRHYVKPRLKTQLIGIADKVNAKNNKLKVSYLDANFPFIDGFPLLPHLSHNDGRKVDLAFYYTKDNQQGNRKPSRTGYGKFVEPLNSEYNQARECLRMGHWQYDYTKYFSLGGTNDLEFDPKNTSELVNMIASDSHVQKIFIEPHLKQRMKLTSNKIRFQGCHAVRHDDHIHFQIN